MNPRRYTGIYKQNKMATCRKRDRWDSSSEDEDDRKLKKDVSTRFKTKQTSLLSSKSSRCENLNAEKDDDATSTNGNKNIISMTHSAHRNGNGLILENNKETNKRDETDGEEKNQHFFQNLPRHNSLLSGCRSVYDCYERLAHLDEGTYGVVWKARDLATDEIVALKQIKFDSALMKDGFPMAALREIGVLLALSHECIVTVKEMVVGSSFDKVFMVMEYLEMDLQQAMKKSVSPFPQSEVKNMLFQILSATHHIHDKWILHRDLKTSNILVHKSGKIALCDFGLARKYQMPLKALTQMVITLWYRPPELLFGETTYGPEVDMWSIGCIFGELLRKEAMLQGRGELDQIDLIFKLLSVPDDETWPGFTKLPNTGLFRWKNKEGSKLKETFPVNSFSGEQTYLDPNGFDLLSKLLTMNPKHRITAQDALNHRYFKEGVEMQTPQFSF